MPAHGNAEMQLLDTTLQASAKEAHDIQKISKGLLLGTRYPKDIYSSGRLKWISKADPWVS